MFRVTIITVGKSKESWLNDALSEYERRLKGRITVDWVYVRDDAALIRKVEQERRPVFCDETGTQHDSRGFSSWFEKLAVEGGGKISFVIGGAEGLPLILRNRKPAISLSPLTFTHQIVRLILLEQLYRAAEIIKGSPYHK